MGKICILDFTEGCKQWFWGSEADASYCHYWKLYKSEKVASLSLTKYLVYRRHTDVFTMNERMNEWFNEWVQGNGRAFQIESYPIEFSLEKIYIFCDL